MLKLELNMENVALLIHNEWNTIDWHEKFEGQNIEDMWKLVSDQYHKSIEEHVLKYPPPPHSKKKRPTRPLWMNAESLYSI